MANFEKFADDEDKVRRISHRTQPWEPAGLAAAAPPRAIAQGYISQFGARELGITNVLSPDRVDYGSPVPGQPSSYRFEDEKNTLGTTIVSYLQTVCNTPIWKVGLKIAIEKGKVVSAVDHSHKGSIVVTMPPPEAIEKYKRCITESAEMPAEMPEVSTLQQVLSSNIGGNPVPTRCRFFIYQFQLEKRVSKEANHRTLSLPSVPAQIPENTYRLVVEVTFLQPSTGQDKMTWLALIDVETDAILYLRPLSSNVRGSVFRFDPITGGRPQGFPTANNAILNPFREEVNLIVNRTETAVQSLEGEWGKLVDFDGSRHISPALPVGQDFHYDVRTDDFAAVNAYYHHHRLFETLKELGFDPLEYLYGTTFPIPVDHRGLEEEGAGRTINAHCVGNDTGTGIGHVCYALADMNTAQGPIGISLDWRVHLHEVFGHGILYPHVHFPNFRFAHSAGDSFAAILCDPHSQALDRFETFPWVGIGRRHDRRVEDGWGWRGWQAKERGYPAEQVLSTTMFRFYRSIGGDSSSVNHKIMASQTAAYLILRAIATLTPTTNPRTGGEFLEALLDADTLASSLEGYEGGAYGKVLRWAFEKQGLFALPAQPTSVVGQPPNVDVYVEDGNQGNYTYRDTFWDSAIWNRNLPDGEAGHQQPTSNQPNYLYVEINNRGLRAASDPVVVTVYTTLLSAGHTYPDDFTPIGERTVPTPQPNHPVVVGPFQWTPQTGSYSFLAILSHNESDLANTDVRPESSFPAWRLVPNDNNIGMRSNSEVAFSSTVVYLDQLELVVKNPLHKEATMSFALELPAELERLGWTFTQTSFKLLPGASKKLSLPSLTGTRLSAAAVRGINGEKMVLKVFANGVLIGGSNCLLKKMEAQAGLMAASVADASATLFAFFDIGDTLGTASWTPDGELQFKPYPSAESVLKQLQGLGVKLGLISNTPESWNESIFGPLLQYFEKGLKLYSSIEGLPEKPDPALFKLALERAKESNDRATPSSCLFVGESAVERRTASFLGFRVAPSLSTTVSAALGQPFGLYSTTLDAIKDVNGLVLDATDPGATVALLTRDQSTRIGRRAEIRLLQSLSNGIAAFYSSGDSLPIPGGWSLQEEATHNAVLMPLDARAIRSVPLNVPSDLPQIPAEYVTQLQSIITADSIAKVVHELSNSDTINNRHVSSPGNREAARWIESELAAITGLTVTRHRFAMSGEIVSPPVRGVLQLDNIIGDLPGQEAGVIVLGAHFDSTAEASFGFGYDPTKHPAPGADDNASGVAAVLLAAKALAAFFQQRNSKPKHTIRFAFFNAEEQRLVGSRHYVRTLSRTEEATRIKAMIQVDTIGLNLATRQFEIHSGSRSPEIRMASDRLGDLIADAYSFLKTIPGMLPTLNDVDPFSNSTDDPAAGRSDHGSFHAIGVPAVVVCNDFFPSARGPGETNPNYHKVEDTVINPDYTSEIAQVVCAAVLRLANA